MSIASNITTVKKQLPPHCKLICVSKTQPTEKVMEAYQAGHRLFGENKAQELVAKFDALPKDIEWHMIGHLQSNKVKYIAPFVTLIHSIDSIKLLLEVNKQGIKFQRVIPCLLQVHIAHEETKFGFSEEEVLEFVQQHEHNHWKNILIKGLMGMATFTGNKEQIRNEFSALKILYDKLRGASLPANFQITELSMGMSGDYSIAVEEGSTMVRLGTSIFGERIPK